MRETLIRRSKELLIFVMWLGATANLARAQEKSPWAILIVPSPALYVESPALYRQTYAEACAEAIHSNRPLVVFVGLPMPADKYLDPSAFSLLSSRSVLVCGVPKLEGYPARCIVYAKPVGNNILWERTEDENGNVIDSPKMAKAVQPPAAIFSRSVFAGSAAVVCGSGG